MNCLPRIVAWIIPVSLLLAANGLSGQTFRMNEGDQNLCSGRLLDSGGEQAPYQANEDFTITLCSDGSTETHLQLFFSALELSDSDQLCFYDGPDTDAPLLACASDFNFRAPFIIQATAANPSGCITITFTSDDQGQGAGWSADLQCVTNCQPIRADLLETRPAPAPDAEGWIDICPGDTVLFRAAGQYPQNGLNYAQSDATSTFTWDFGDGNTGEGPEVRHVFRESGGYFVNLVIRDTAGCRSTNLIQQRVRVAPPAQITLDTSALAPVCRGDTFTIRASRDTAVSGLELEARPGRVFFPTGGIRADSLPLLESEARSYATSIRLTNFTPGQTLTDYRELEKIFVEIEHSFARDLEIDITCPNGQSAILHQYEGQQGSQIRLGQPVEENQGEPFQLGVGAEYAWTPNATRSNWLLYADSLNAEPLNLPPGNYQPFNSLAQLEGCPLNGEWTLNIEDRWVFDNGFLFSWGIQFAPQLYPDIETFSPALVNASWEAPETVIFQSADSLIHAPASSGSLPYRYSVTDAFGCTTDTTFFKEVRSALHPDCRQCPEPAFRFRDTSICQNDTLRFDLRNLELSADSVLSHHWLEGQNLSCTDCPNPTAAPDSSGRYVAEILTADSCTFRDTLQVTVFPIFTPPEVSCFTSGPDELTFTWDAAPPDQEFEVRLLRDTGATNWIRYGPDTSFIAGNLMEGDSLTLELRIFVGDNPLGCRQPVSREGCRFNACVLDIRITDLQEVSCAGGADGALAVETAGGQPPYTYRLEGGGAPQAAGVFDSLAPGNYRLIAADDGFCLDTLPFTIGAPETLELTLRTEREISCRGAADGILNSQVKGGSGSYRFAWRHDTSLEAPRAEGLAAGLYNLTITDANGCTAVDSLGLVDPDSLIVDLTPTDPSCFNRSDGRIAANASGGTPPLSYNWNNGSRQANLEGLQPGAYCLTVTDARGCTLDTCQTLAGPDSIAIDSVVITPVLCHGNTSGSATVFVRDTSLELQYAWNDPLGQIGPTANNLPGGRYEVSITSARGCRLIRQVGIPEPPPLALEFTSQDISCRGDSTGRAEIAVEGGSPPYRYRWNTGDSTALIDSLPAGDYAFTVTDQNGCSLEQRLTIGQPSDPLTLELQQTRRGCFGEQANEITATVGGGSGGDYEFSWSHGHDGPVARGLDTIRHTLSVTDANGCRLTDTLTPRDIPRIDPNVIISTPSCSGSSDGALGINFIEGGVGNTLEDYTIEWSTGETTPTIEGLAGGQEYSVTVTDQRACSAVTTRFMEDPPEVSFDIQSEDLSCYNQREGAATIVNLQPAGSTFTIEWDQATGNQTGLTAEGLAAGTYYVTVSGRGDCQETGEVTISQPEELTLDLTVVDNECYGENLGSIDVLAKGGVPGYQYTWEGGRAGRSLSELRAGDYRLTVTDANGCALTRTVTVEQPPLLQAEIIIDSITCAGFQNGGITVRTEGGTPPFRFSLDNETFSSSNEFVGLDAGRYDIHIRDANGCRFLERVVLEEPPPFRVEAGPSQILIQLGDTLQLQAESENGFGMVEYEWIPAFDSTLSCRQCPAPLAFPQYTITYELLGLDERGCEASDFLTVNVEKPRVVEVPTGFTPNGDNNNDLLQVHGREGTRVLLFRVFDSWGELLFETGDQRVNDPSWGWDGLFQGQPMPAGVYVWYLEVEFIDGARQAYRGQTTLIR